MVKVIILLFVFAFNTSILAKGDLAIRAKKLELKLGSDKSDYDMSVSYTHLTLPTNSRV